MFEIFQNELNIQKIALACYVPKGCGNKKHFNRQNHGLAFNCSGRKEFVFSDGKRITVDKNRIIYLPKNSTYIVESSEIGDCYAINFDIDSNCSFEPFSVCAKNSLNLLELFKNAEQVWTSKTTGYNLKCKSLLYEIIYLMQTEHHYKYIDKQKGQIINPAVLFIHNEYLRSEIYVSELAKMCNITPEYFRKIFKCLYGTSPAKYIIDLKLEHAKELLSSGQYSVTEAMLLSGYDNSAYFSHQFKKKYGISPNEIKGK